MNVGYKHGAFIGWRTFNAFVAERLQLGEPCDRDALALDEHDSPPGSMTNVLMNER